MNYNEFANHDDYVQYVVDLISKLEADSLRPLVEDVGDGKATIGYGYTFNRNDNLLLWESAGITLTQAQKDVLTKIDAAPSASKTSIALTEFTRAITLAEAKNLLKYTYTKYEDVANSLGMPESIEKAVVVSLTYNRGSGNVYDQMQDFIAAINNGNRAEAWYQIRYNAQSPSVKFRNGIANRRYVESERFGLYDNPSSITSYEAHNIAQMYTRNRFVILSYENLYKPQTAAVQKSEPGIQDIYHEMAQVIDKLKMEYGISTGFNIEEVQMLDQSTFAIINNLSGDGTSYDGSNNDQDLLIGNSLNNIINGGGGNDALIGLDGDDILDGSRGGDIIDGGAGNDTVTYVNSSSAVDVNLFLTISQKGGDAEGDILRNIENIIGSSYDDILIGSSADNNFNGGGGSDIISGGGGNDVIDGGSGSDTINYKISGAVNVNLATGIATGAGISEHLYNIENVTGSAFSDTIIGDSGANVITGGGGDDTLTGGSGNDLFSFFMGDGMDTITDAENSDYIMFTDLLGGPNIIGGMATSIGNGLFELGKYDLLQSGNDLSIDSKYGSSVIIKNFFKPNVDANGQPVATPGFDSLGNYNGTAAYSFMGITIPPVSTNEKSAMDINIASIPNNNVRICPIVLDLNGDGIKYKSFSTGGYNVHFDIDSDGFAEGMEWLDANDGFLVRDLNGNGRIDNGNEMFGEGGGTTAYYKLAQMDSNHDNNYNRYTYKIMDKLFLSSISYC